MTLWRCIATKFNTNLTMFVKTELCHLMTLRGVALQAMHDITILHGHQVPDKCCHVCRQRCQRGVR